MSKKRTPEPQALQTIDPTTLANVSGGRTRTASGSSSSSSSSSGSVDDATLTALTGILDSLKSLNSNRNSGFGTNEMLLLMMVMGRGNQQPTVVTTGAPPMSPWGYGPPWGY